MIPLALILFACAPPEADTDALVDETGYLDPGLLSFGSSAPLGAEPVSVRVVGLPGMLEAGGSLTVTQALDGQSLSADLTLNQPDEPRAPEEAQAQTGPPFPAPDANGATTLDTRQVSVRYPLILANTDLGASLRVDNDSQPARIAATVGDEICLFTEGSGLLNCLFVSDLPRAP